jgi:hypothetical protein
VKATADTYKGGAHDGEQRLRFVAAKMLPHSYAEENKMLLKRLKMYAKNSGYDAEMM